ncbi:hypothetical protein ABPG72_021566 [Tetrahymena utriculariae]
MEDNIVIIRSEKSDLEKNLIESEQGTVVASKSSFNKKNLAYGLIGLLLLSGIIAGIFLIVNCEHKVEPVKIPVPAQNVEVISEETKQDILQAPKQGPINNQYVPTTFDLRMQSYALNCNFDRPDEMLCVGGNWSNVIASTISNTICAQSVTASEKALSSQYLLNCSNLQDKCNILSSLQDFESQLQFVEKTGIPYASCLAYNGLQYQINPNSCDAKCTDGSDIVLQQYKLVSLWDSNNDSQATILNVKSHLYNYGPVIALVKHSATVARYAGATPNGIFVNDPQDKSNFGYRAFKVVGWNQAAGDTPLGFWIMANTFSNNWGMNGYMRTTLNEPIIQGYYGYIPQ